ncbi:MAG: hypothetical protein GX952_03900 [Firmicutes bacterium]|nr:hypothetical protein [Bacillota bacterium]
MIIVNFSHPLNEEQTRAISAQAGQPIEMIHNISCYLDHERPFAEQIAKLIESVPLSPFDWQTKPILVNLPSLSCAAAVLLAHLHGLLGYFPPCIRLKPNQQGIIRKFDLAELIDLQTLREDARSYRG